jgi:hypothetical protein
VRYVILSMAFSAGRRTLTTWRAESSPDKERLQMSYDTEDEVIDPVTDATDPADTFEDADEDMVALKIKRAD